MLINFVSGFTSVTQLYIVGMMRHDQTFNIEIYDINELGNDQLYLIKKTFSSLTNSVGVPYAMQH